MDAFIKKRLQHKQNVTTNVPQTVPEIFIFFKFYSMDTERKIIVYNLEHTLQFVKCIHMFLQFTSNTNLLGSDISIANDIY